LVRCDQLLSSRNLKVLRQSICGYDNEVPNVCCPIAKKVTQSTAKPRPTRPPTKRPKAPKTKPTLRATTSTPRDVVDDQPSGPNLGLRPRKLPELSHPGAWPWMAAVFIEDSDNQGSFIAQCGGALISEQEIITASHCVVEGGRVLTPEKIRIRLGEHNIMKRTKDDAEVDYNVIKVTAHPDFEPQTYKNDVAIIKLSQRVRFNRRVWPICLPYDTRVLTSEENVGRSGFIIGWGRLEFNGKTSEELREASIEIVSNKECGQAFDKVVKITDEYLCAGTTGSTKDSCQGDSGGPLIQVDPENKKYYLTGIVSFGKRCATPGFP
ncbi:unnamed protein product, partial [Oppiella nova]